MSINSVHGTSLRYNLHNNYNHSRLVITKRIAIETAQHLYGSKLVPDDISIKQLQTLFDTAYIKKEFKYRVTVIV